MSAQIALLLFQLARLASPTAVDHVATMEQQNSGGPPDRAIVYRSGSQMRVDSTTSAGSETAYTDRRTGLETSIMRDRQGTIQRITIHGLYERMRRLTPTGRRDRALGYPCIISRLAADRSSTGAEICETADGILLWHAFWYPPDETHMYSRAIGFERRPVRPEEVLPPRDLLALASERPAPAASGGTATRGDFALRLVGDDPADGSSVRRHHGPFWSDDRGEQGGGRSLYVGNGAVSVNYTEDESGRPQALEITRAGYSRIGLIEPRWQNVPGRAPERLLGETCVWQGNAAIQSDDTDYECRTADGIPLRTEQRSHWTGGTRRFTARSLSRRPLRDQDFAVPARAFDWAAWGITPAP